jgi:hypothetical protein
LPAAVGLVGKESDLFRFTVKHSLIFTCMVGLITTLQDCGEIILPVTPPVVLAATSRISETPICCAAVACSV